MPQFFQVSMFDAFVLGYLVFQFWFEDMHIDTG